jgi:hypothetical protein
MKNASTTYEEYVLSSLPIQKTFPTPPFPRKYVHSVIDDLQQVEHRLQQQSRFSEMLFRFFASTDDGFPGDVYLHEAQLGHLILLVHLKSAVQMEQVSDLLTFHRAYYIKYIGTWTVTDLPSSAVPNG